MKTLTVGSLFSGIGGLELGLERAGMKTLWQVEQDPYARKILEKHWPHCHRVGDIRTARGVCKCDGFSNCHNECLEPVDLICGGFPCQDISVAGKGKGLAGERSGLWREFARIIGEVRPSWVLIENVPALRSRGLAQVLSDLAALGFDAEWDCFRASDVGAPHKRERIFVVAHAPGKQNNLPSGARSNLPATAAHGRNRDVAHAQRFAGEPRRPSDAFESARGRDADRSGLGPDVSDADRERLEKRIFQPARNEQPAAERGGLRADAWSSEPDVGRVAHGVPSRVDRLRCLGNAVIPAVAYHVGRCIVAAENA